MVIRRRSPNNFLVLALAGFGLALAGQAVAQNSISVLQSVLSIAKTNHKSLGIVINREREMCNEIKIPARSFNEARNLADLLKMQPHLSISQSEVPTIRIGTDSVEIQEALNVNFPRFPEQTSTIESLGSTLNGWLYATTTGRGFATENAFSGEEELYHLPLMMKATVLQIANKIASFGGVWVAVEPRKPKVSTPSKVPPSITFYSFANINASQIAAEYCKPDAVADR